MTSATLSPDTATPSRPPAPRRIPTPRSARARRILAWVAEHAVLVVLAVLFISPVVFVFLTSLMSSEQTLTASLWPQPFQWDNYVKVFTTVPLAQWFANSALYAVLATAFMLISSVPAAYALAKIRFRGSGVLFTVIHTALETTAATPRHSITGVAPKGTGGFAPPEASIVIIVTVAA